MSFKTTFIINYSHEKVDNKMYCVGCIMFGIANKNYVTIPDTNILKFIFVSTVVRLENIKVCYWAMYKICKGGGARTYLHKLGDICCVEEA